MNSGKAVSVQEDEADQIVVSITSPTGRVVNSSIPTQATPISAMPTQTPEPSSRNSTKRKRMIVEMSSIALFPEALIYQIAFDPVAALGDDLIKVIGEGDSHDHGANQHQ